MENLGNEENKEEIINKWAGILGTASSDKLDWMTQYVAAHSANENVGGAAIWGSQTATQSSSFSSLLPLAVQVTAKSIGFDLVSVQPMGGDYTLLDKVKKKVTAVNRERQIDDILDDKPFEPLKLEETQEYQDYLKSGSPKGNLFYIDYQYGNATVSNTSNVNSPKRNPFKPIRKYKKTK